MDLDGYTYDQVLAVTTHRPKEYTMNEVASSCGRMRVLVQHLHVEKVRGEAAGEVDALFLGNLTRR